MEVGQHRQICEHLEVRYLGLGGYRAGYLKGCLGRSRRWEAAHPALSLYTALHKVDNRDFK